VGMAAPAWESGPSQCDYRGWHGSGQLRLPFVAGWVGPKSHAAPPKAPHALHMTVRVSPSCSNY